MKTNSNEACRIVLPSSLGGTAGMMASASYKERFAAEYAQLCIRHGRLARMLSQCRGGGLGFRLSSPFWMLAMQARAMEMYMLILRARAAREGIAFQWEDGAVGEKEAGNDAV